jgi:hypothetical protein
MDALIVAVDAGTVAANALVHVAPVAVIDERVGCYKRMSGGKVGTSRITSGCRFTLSFIACLGVIGGNDGPAGLLEVSGPGTRSAFLQHSTLLLEVVRNVVLSL